MKLTYILFLKALVFLPTKALSSSQSTLGAPALWALVLASRCTLIGTTLLVQGVVGDLSQPASCFPSLPPF